LNKKVLGVFIAAVLLLSVSVGASYAASLGNSADHRQDGAQKQLKVGNPHQFKQLKLMYTMADPGGEDQAVWVHVPGNEVSGFKLSLDPTVEYYYLDVMSLKAYAGQALQDPYDYPFYIDPSSASQEYIDEWEAKIEMFPAEWRDAARAIFIDGTAPIFYLSVDSGEYMLVDGFQRDVYAEGGLGNYPLRINGDYTLGTFTYITHPTDGEPGHGLQLSMTITFRVCEYDDMEDQ
jgi:hypothetical protein